MKAWQINKCLQRILLSLLFTTTFIILIVLCAIATFNIETHRNQIIPFVSKILQREFSIDGKIRLDKSLNPKLTVEDILIKNPSWASSPFFIKAKQAEIQISFLALLKGEFQILEFKLSDAQVHLEKDLSGTPNWFFGKKKKKRFKVVPAISSLVIENTQFFFHNNGQPDKILFISELESAIEMASPIKINSKLVYEEIPFQLSVSSHQPEKDKPLAINIKLFASDLTAEFQGFWQNPFQGFNITGALDLHIAEMTVISKLLKQKWRYSQPLQISGQLAYDIRKAEFFDVLLETPGMGSAGVIKYNRDSTPRWDLNLKKTVINTEQFIKYKKKDKKSHTAGSSAADVKRIIPDFSINGEILKKLNMAIQSDELEVMYNDELITTVKGKLSIANGVYKVSPFESYSPTGSDSKASLIIDASVDPPAVELFWQMNQMDYGLILKNIGISGDIIGKLNLKLQLMSCGTTLRELLGNADGNLEMVTDKGRIPKRYLELWGGGLLRLLIPTTWFEKDVTDMNCTVCRFIFDDGIMQSNLLLSDTERITVAGELTLDLKTEKISGVFKPKSKQASFFKLGTPIKVSGSLAKIRTSSAESGLVTLGKLIVGASNPSTIILIFGDLGASEKNPCKALLQHPLHE